MLGSHGPAPILCSIQVGTPKDYGSDDLPYAHDKFWTTSFFKAPVEGRIFAGKMNLVGDSQADLENHGGVDKAVLAYSADHYPKWRDELVLPDMPFGAFGENLTISGLSEGSVCIGDIFRIGAATFEVSQPRQPCWKLARRWRMHDLVRLVVNNGRTGWYFRVLEEGWIESRMPVQLIDRPNAEWPISRANQIMYHRVANLPLALQLAEVPGLSDSWVWALRERVERISGSGVSE